MILDHGDVRATLVRLSAPVAIAIVADQLLGVVDTIAIGTLGVAALAAIAAAVTSFMVVGIGQYAFSTGPRIIAAQAIGNGDTDRYARAIRAGLPLPLAVGAIVIALLHAFAVPLMALLLGGTVGAHAAASYLLLRSWSLLPMAITGLAITAFAAAGDSSLALRVLVVINLVHLPLLGALVLGIGTHHSFGLAGAGVSTLLSETAGMAYALQQVSRRPKYRLLSSWRIDRTLVLESARLSWPEFVFLTTLVVPEPLAVWLLAHEGTLAIASLRALNLVSDATWSLPGSLGDAMEIVVAQRLGARDVAGAASFLHRATVFCVRVCAVAGVVVALFSWPLAALVTWSALVARVAAGPLALHMLTLPLKGWSLAAAAPIRACGDTSFVMRVGLVTSALAAAVMTLLALRFGLGLWSVPIAWILAWAARLALTVLRVRSNDWQRRRLAA